MPPKRRPRRITPTHLATLDVPGNIGSIPMLTSAQCRKQLAELRDELNSEIAAQAIDLKAAQDKIAELQDELEDSQEEQENEELERQIEELEQKLEDRETEFEENLEAKMDEMEKRLEDMEVERDVARDEAKENDEALEDCKEDNKRLKDEVLVLEDQEKENEKLSAVLGDVIEDLILITESEDLDESVSLAHKVLKRLAREGYDKLLREEYGYDV